MAASRTIIEVLGRATQGTTRPFLCRADDGLLYYVKGEDAGRRSLCCEWVASHLARAYGLQVPDFAIAEVPATLVVASDRDDIGDLGAGLVFSSRALASAHEVTWVEADACDHLVKSKLLLFDWWVHNEDRSLNEQRGNPNLLVTSGTIPNLWVFDFNLAFDPTFSESGFWRDHVFARHVQSWSRDFRDVVEPQLRSALDSLTEVFDTVPKEWLYLDGDENLACYLEGPTVRKLLMRAFTAAEEFWRRP